MPYKDNKAWRLKYPSKRSIQRKRYYKKSQNAFMKGETWSNTDEKFILTSEGPDSVMHTIIERSIQAIQLKRCKLRKEIEGRENAKRQTNLHNNGSPHHADRL